MCIRDRPQESPRSAAVRRRSLLACLHDFGHAGTPARNRRMRRTRDRRTESRHVPLFQGHREREPDLIMPERPFGRSYDPSETVSAHFGGPDFRLDFAPASGRSHTNKIPRTARQSVRGIRLSCTNLQTARLNLFRLFHQSDLVDAEIGWVSQIITDYLENKFIYRTKRGQINFTPSA